MFGKLLKHKWKDMLQPLGLASLGTLVTACISALITNQRFNNPENAVEFGDLLQGVFLITSIVFLVLYLILPGYFMLYRFYRRHFTDEGYLTFTLPATAHEHLLSSMTNMLIWNVIGAVVAVICGWIMIWPFLEFLTGMDFDMGLTKEELDAITNYQYSDPVSSVINFIATPLYTIVVPMAALTVGCTVARNHKLLASFGIYYVVNLVMTEVFQIFNYASVENGIYWLQGLIRLGISVAAYFLMHYLIEKRLNI